MLMDAMGRSLQPDRTPVLDMQRPLAPFESRITRDEFSGCALL